MADTKIIEVTGSSPVVTVDSSMSNVSVSSTPINVEVSSAVVTGNATIRNALDAYDPIYYDRTNGIFGFLDRSEVVRSEKMIDPATQPNYAGAFSGDINLDAENYDIFVIAIGGDITSITFDNIVDGQTVTILGTQSSTPGDIIATGNAFSNWFWVDSKDSLPQTQNTLFEIKVLYTGNTYYADISEFTLPDSDQPTIQVSANPPQGPTEGELWYRYQNVTDPDALMIYVNNAWIVAGGGGGGAQVSIGPTAPTNPEVGDLWYATNVSPSVLNIYTGTVWEDAATGSIGYTGSQGFRGYTGSQGTTGFNGSRGFIGYTGSSGQDTLSNVLTAGDNAEGQNLSNVSYISFSDVNQGTGQFATTYFYGRTGKAEFASETLYTTETGFLPEAIDLAAVQTTNFRANVNISKGDVLYQDTANSALIDRYRNVDAKLCDTSDPDFDPDKIIGFAMGNVSVGSEGAALTSGAFTFIDQMSNLSANDILYVDNSTPGGFTTTPDTQSSSNVQVKLGTVLEGGNASVGWKNRIQVKIDVINKLNDLDSVTITNPQNSEVLVYNSTSQTWTNQAGGAGGVGYTGSQGFTGSAGFTGSTGTGDQGFTGSQGIQGIQGFTGSAGTGGGGAALYIEVLDGGAPGFKTGTSVFEVDGGNSIVNASGDYIYDGGTA